MQRQTTQLQSLISKQPRRSSTSASTPPSAQNLTTELATKQAKIETLELDLSNINAELTSEKEKTSSQAQSIESLDSSLARVKASQSSTATELSTLKASLENASKEGSERNSSAKTRIATLEAELAAAKQSVATAEARALTLERKVEALTGLHREAEARNAAKRAGTKATDSNNKNGEDVKEEDEEADDPDGQIVSELESESRNQMQARIRALEDEVFELRRAEWRHKRRELQPEILADHASGRAAPNTTKDGEPISPPFHDVDLSSGGGSGAGGNQAAAAAATSSSAVRRGASSFAHALSSGFSAFTNPNQHNAYGSNNVPFNHVPNNAASFNEKALNDGDIIDGDPDADADMNFDFDESAFRAAQEEEARLRVERVREVKRGLAAWKGWRVDLVGERGGIVGGARADRAAGDDDNGGVKGEGGAGSGEGVDVIGTRGGGVGGSADSRLSRAVGGMMGDVFEI